MAKSNVRLDFKQLEQFQKELQKAQAEQDKFFKACAKELAARLLAKVVKRTPVGQYPTETGKRVARCAGVGQVKNKRMPEHTQIQ